MVLCILPCQVDLSSLDPGRRRWWWQVHVYALSLPSRAVLPIWREPSLLSCNARPQLSVSVFEISKRRKRVHLRNLQSLQSTNSAHKLLSSPLKEALQLTTCDLGHSFACDYVIVPECLLSNLSCDVETERHRILFRELPFHSHMVQLAWVSSLLQELTIYLLGHHLLNHYLGLG